MVLTGGLRPSSLEPATTSRPRRTAKPPRKVFLNGEGLIELIGRVIGRTESTASQYGPDRIPVNHGPERKGVPEECTRHRIGHDRSTSLIALERTMTSRDSQ